MENLVIRIQNLTLSNNFELFGRYYRDSLLRGAIIEAVRDDNSPKECQQRFYISDANLDYLKVNRKMKLKEQDCLCCGKKQSFEISCRKKSPWFIL